MSGPDVKAYDLGEDGEQWMVEGTLDPAEAEQAVRALWAEQGVAEDYAELMTDDIGFKFSPSDAWWWEPTNSDYPDDETWLRGVINGNPAPEGVETFTGVLVVL